MPPLPVRAGAASRAGRVPGARARLRGVLRVERVPLQVLGAAGQPLPPQHHLGRAVLHHPAAREGANASQVRGEQPRDGGVHRQGVPVRCVPASALLTPPPPPPSPGSPERTTASQVQQLGRGVFSRIRRFTDLQKRHLNCEAGGDTRDDESRARRER